MEIYQISVFLENQAGKLAEVTNILAENGIDLRAINIAESSDYGVLRVITSDAEKAVETLRKHNFIVNCTEVLCVSVPDRPGGLAHLLRMLAAENFDVEYMYSIFGQTNGLAYMILRVDNIEEVRSVLEKDGIHTADCAELGIK
ncbi:MAG: ACT domain-containing protein [Anaerolineaceae bacterium]|nr:ACT domain-containing protein [Anaerolineaceae bacterium]